MSKLIRNSTEEFLIFITQEDKNSIETQYKDGTVWFLQKLMATLFEVDVSTVNEHLKNIYNNDELDKNTIIGDFPIVQKEGSRALKRTIAFYNLDAIIFDKLMIE
ncbi:hypothetical protein HUE58_03155 [Candidatus Ruthia endofausta]|uniref:Virulence RhuM family protein n=1 Tax=Candidatus Ruthia endofausta TaxID=2738852 RepID=A0A6N0HPC4_9GAMM|nr:hypothetical protein [Candidatus Ruthia endofausta]QKQ24156.1 hypothetical protein HUE58_03155 [Candidatus Ruthia endofausta]